MAFYFLQKSQMGGFIKNSIDPVFYVTYSSIESDDILSILKFKKEIIEDEKN